MQFLEIGEHHNWAFLHSEKILDQENPGFLNDSDNEKKYIKELKAIILKDQSTAEEHIKSCIPSFIGYSRELNYFRQVNFLDDESLFIEPP